MPWSSMEPRLTAAKTPNRMPKIVPNKSDIIPNSRVAGKSALNSVHTLVLVTNDLPKLPWAKFPK